MIAMSYITSYNDGYTISDSKRCIRYDDDVHS